MPCRGMDISNYQSGMDVAHVVRANRLAFVFILSNDGTFRNVYYHQQATAARSAGAVVVPYMYLRTNVDDTVNTHINMCGTTGPTIVDVEHGSGDISHVNRAHDLLHQHGRTTPLGYIPEWYWRDHMGSPDMSHLPINGLWVSWYPDYVPRNYDAGAAIILDAAYSYLWDSYGGQPVHIVQFTSSGQLAGYPANVDLNYYPGSRKQLAALLGETPSAAKENDVSIVPFTFEQTKGEWQNYCGAVALGHKSLLTERLWLSIGSAFGDTEYILILEGDGGYHAPAASNADMGTWDTPAVVTSGARHYFELPAAVEVVSLHYRNTSDPTVLGGAWEQDPK